MIDEIDRMILTLLKEDARRKYSDLGELVHLSAPAVHERVKKLERAGVIDKYTIDVNHQALGLLLQAFVHVHVSHAPCEEMARSFHTIPEIIECFSSAGEESMVLKVQTGSPPELETLLNRIRQTPGVERVQTSLILTTHFQRDNIVANK